MNFPFTCDYAKSNRSVCRGCQNTIVKGTLRVAIMLQSNTFDQKVPNWFHFQCFFIEHMPQSCREIESFDLLQWEDQEKIKTIIVKGESPYESQENREQLKRDISKANSQASVKNYSIDYSKAARIPCVVCEIKVAKSEIRIVKKMSKKNEIYHLKCFVGVHHKLDYLESGSKMNGFSELSDEDQELVKQQLPGSYETPPKKKCLNPEAKEFRPRSHEEIISKDNNRIMHEFRKNLKSNLTKDELTALLKKNKQIVPSGIENILDRLSDMLTYGALTRCMNCERGNLEFSNIGYKCKGSFNSWRKCNYVTSDPIRNHVIIPQDLKLKYDFLYKYEYVPRKRVIDQSFEIERVTFGPLRYHNIYLHGFSQEENTALFNRVKSLAGRVVSEVRRSVFCVITTKEKVGLTTDIINKAKECEVYVVSKEFLNDVHGHVSLDDVAKKHSLVSWGTELAVCSVVLGKKK